jgi:hypothetical protein
MSTIGLTTTQLAWIIALVVIVATGIVNSIPSRHQTASGPAQTSGAPAS